MRVRFDRWFRILLLWRAAIGVGSLFAAQPSQLAWDPNPPEDGVTGYKIWVNTNLAGGTGLTNITWAEFSTNLVSTNFITTANGWKVWKTVPGDVTNVVISEFRGKHTFFALTCTNQWGLESLFSNAAWSQRKPTGSALRIE